MTHEYQCFVCHRWAVSSECHAVLPCPDCGNAAIRKIPIVKIKETGQVFYALQPKQYEAYLLTPLAKAPNEPYSSFIGYGGSAGPGKSYLARAVVADVALRWPGSTSILFRATEREVVSNHVNKMRGEIQSDVQGRRLYHYNGQDLVATWFNGSRTYFGYLKQDKDVFTYQGPEYDVMVFEEATHYTYFQVSWLTSNRLRSTVQGSRPFALFPSNPGNRGHFWYKRWFVDRRFHEADGEYPEDYVFIQGRLADNLELNYRDPRYAKRLDKLTEPWRSWMRDGDFKAGAGTALGELDRQKHMIPAFERPAHWPVFCAFDWGYHHPFSWGFYTTSEDGVLFKIDTLIDRHKLPHEIAERVRGRMSHLHITKIDHTVAGHDAWAEIKARGEDTPTIADQMAEHGLPLVQANIDRKMGLQALRRVLAWKTTGEGGTPGEPQFFMFETEGNAKTYDQLETRVTDPEDIEDVLKTDGDEWGEGGDDSYDETRYAVASRPQAARSNWGKAENVSAWSPEMLVAERERLTRGRGDRAVRPSTQDSENEWEVM